MAKQQQLLNLQPYNASEMFDDHTMVPNDPPDVQQLKIDIINVIEGRVLIESFPSDYQTKIKDYYRFYGQRSSPQYPFYPKMTRSTLEAC